MVTRSCRMRARVAQATVRVWVEGRDDPCSLTVLVDPEGVDLSRPECFSPRAFMKSPSIYKRVRVRGDSERVLVSCAEGGHDTAHHQPGHDRPSGPWSFETERQPRSSRPHTAEPEQLRGPLSPYHARPGHTGGRYDEDAGLCRD